MVIKFSQETDNKWSKRLNDLIPGDGKRNGGRPDRRWKEAIEKVCTENLAEMGTVPRLMDKFGEALCP